QIEGVEELLAPHILVARGHIALGDAKLASPARDRVFVVAGQDVVALDQVPGTGAATEGVDLVPRQVASPTADGVPGRAAAAATEQSKANILHLVEMPDPLQADDQGKDTGPRPAQHAVLAGAEPRPR